MSNENQQVVAATAFKEMQTDIQVSMDDVVSAFVSEYENNLYKRKKELTADVKEAEGRLSKFIKDVHKEVNADEFTSVKMPFGLTIKADEGSIDWLKASMHFQLTITTENNDRYGNTITIRKVKKIKKSTITQHEKLADACDDLRSQLSEVLVSLKSITRKERQVRGRIAVRKLEDSGYANLMQDQELAALVQLD